MRVFHDRLINSEDKNMFIEECKVIGNTFQALAKQEEEENKDEKKDEKK